MWSFTLPDTPTRRKWNMDGVGREALVYVPPKAKTAATPVVFAFHGHGGTANHDAQTFGYHALWPEAMVVYLQGRNTPGILTDLEGKKPAGKLASGIRATAT